MDSLTGSPFIHVMSFKVDEILVAKINRHINVPTPPEKNELLLLLLLVAACCCLLLVVVVAACCLLLVFFAPRNLEAMGSQAEKVRLNSTAWVCQKDRPQKTRSASSAILQFRNLESKHANPETKKKLEQQKEVCRCSLYYIYMLVPLLGGSSQDL